MADEREDSTGSSAPSGYGLLWDPHAGMSLHLLQRDAAEHSFKGVIRAGDKAAAFQPLRQTSTPADPLPPPRPVALFHPSFFLPGRTWPPDRADSEQFFYYQLHSPGMRCSEKDHKQTLHPPRAQTSTPALWAGGSKGRGGRQKELRHKGWEITASISWRQQQTKSNSTVHAEHPLGHTSELNRLTATHATGTASFTEREAASLRGAVTGTSSHGTPSLQ